MVLKYKVNEVAKDLNINSNEVIELLSKYSDKPKKAQTVLTAEELNFVFDYFTQKNQVDTFDGYFAMQRPKEEPKKPVAEKAEPKKEGYRILAVTACPTGIAHTYMAAEALEKAGKKLGISIKVETNDSGGAKNILTDEEIAIVEGRNE